MAVSRIGGTALLDNLARQGVDLSFETNLLYLDVNNMRIGVNTATPNVAMDINGITRFSSNLQINGSNIATYAGNGNITLSPNGTGRVIISNLTSGRVPYVSTGGTIVDNANLTFDGTTLTAANIGLGNIGITGNTVSSTNTNGNINLTPNGTGNVIVDTATATRVFYAGANKEIITNANLTFSGTVLAVAGTANATTLIGGNIQVTTNTISSVSGNIVLSPTANVILNNATANTILYSATNKEVLSSSNLTFDGTTLQIGNITATANTIGSANTNGNINLDPTGTGRVVVVGTNAMQLPKGDTSQRPTGVEGDFRFNNELDALEFHDGTTWQTVQNAAGSFQFSESFNGDGGTTVFTLTYATTSSGAFVTLNGVMQSPGVAYSVSGTTMTFTEAPASGDKIDVRYISDADTLSLTSIADLNTSVVANNTSQTANITVNSSLQLQVKATGTKVNGYLATTAPVTKTADFTLADSENYVINNKSGSACVVTLPSASSYTGRQVTFKTIQAQALNSNSSNVVPLIGGAASTSILTGTAGKWAILVSDGTNWVIMAAA